MNTANKCRHSIYKKLPLVIDPKKRYVFYIHDVSAGTCSSLPVEPFVMHGYNQSLEALRDEGFHVISENRPPNTDLIEYALKIAEDIKDLIRAWLPQEHITLVATSQAAAVGSLVSSLLKKEEVNYVLLHATDSKNNVNLIDTRIKLTGNVLSIYASQSEDSSFVKPVCWDTSATHKFEEVALLNTKNQSLLHQPCREWLEPTVNWAKRQY